MKLLEWNINKRTNSIPVQPFVYNRILEQKTDIICLVEYIDDINIKDKLTDEYWFKESVAHSGNQILIAISKKIAPNEMQLVRATEEISCYNFLHVRFVDSCNRGFSVVGVRMLSPMDATIQTPPLNKYLSQIKEPFICIGDFNIKGYRMNHWFPKYKTEILKSSTQEIENSSIVFVDKYSKTIEGFGDFDHVLGSDNLQITSEYKWGFIEDDAIYPKISNIKIGAMWNIKPAYPDHAMMITEIEI
ncbi:hypothetical protein KM799_15035 [Clostridium tyrobutyricum]|uniref:hypothetical protein n=1 Tax=Clostridium tyrobutyricum TaxID=1519 RepID=UPI001C386417|nr:hypothetical protein [Clostridium tyrobutyricum]MBV4447907.1 hypothetical protein [Clostridium tyrobutyricum]